MKRTARNICPLCDAGDPTSVVTSCDCETTPAQSLATFNLVPKAVLSVLPHVSKETNRPILNGIWVREDAALVATNGHTLGMYNQAGTLGEQDKPLPDSMTCEFLPHVLGGVILQVTPNASAWRKLAKGAAKHHVPLVVTLFNAASATVTYAGADTTLTIAIIEGPFPNIQQVFPRDGASQTRETVVSPELVELFTTAADDYKPAVRLTFTGEGRAILVNTDDAAFLGLLMPMSGMAAPANSPDLIPAWVYEKPKMEKTSKAA